MWKVDTVYAHHSIPHHTQNLLRWARIGLKAKSNFKQSNWPVLKTLRSPSIISIVSRGAQLLKRNSTLTILHKQPTNMAANSFPTQGNGISHYPTAMTRIISSHQWKTGSLKSSFFVHDWNSGYRCLKTFGCKHLWLLNNRRIFFKKLKWKSLQGKYNRYRARTSHSEN